MRTKHGLPVRIPQDSNNLQYKSAFLGATGATDAQRGGGLGHSIRNAAGLVVGGIAARYAPNLASMGWSGAKNLMRTGLKSFGSNVGNAIKSTAPELHGLMKNFGKTVDQAAFKMQTMRPDNPALPKINLGVRPMRPPKVPGMNIQVNTAPKVSKAASLYRNLSAIDRAGLRDGYARFVHRELE